MEKLYKCEDVANRYGVKRGAVYSWIRKGCLSAVRIGRSYRVKEAALIAFECQNQTTKPGDGGVL